jgi:hypothetical protein
MRGWKADAFRHRRTGIEKFLVRKGEITLPAGPGTQGFSCA